MIRIATVPFLLLFLATAACGGGDRDGDEPPVQDTVLTPDASTPPSAREPADTAGRPEPGQDTASGQPGRSPEPEARPPGRDLDAVGVNEWTAGIVEGGPEAGPGSVPPTVTGVRIARHPDFDRFVVEFSEAGGLPGFHVEYVDRPVRECGSGHVVELPGDGWLEVHLIGARAHDDEGRVTVETREGSPGLPVLLAHDMTCDFEGQVVWVLAVASPNRFRVLDLREPYRLVVDVRH